MQKPIPEWCSGIFCAPAESPGKESPPAPLKGKPMRTLNRFNHENNSSQQRSLQFKLKTTISDFIKGTYNYTTKKNKPGTGHPWVQIQPIRIFEIDGWAAVDAFDSFGTTFVPLTQRDVLSAVLNNRGIFATAAPIASNELFPKFITHHITEKMSLDRFTRDLKEMFSLSVVLQWKGDQAETEVLPNCRIDSHIQERIDLGYEFVVHRVGMEMDFRKMAEFGVEMNDGNLYSLGTFTKADFDIIGENLVNTIRTFLLNTFDSDIQWGEESGEIPVDDLEQLMEADGDNVVLV
jgi:hypothetical protein